MMGGGGGGRDTMAQAGGTRPGEAGRGARDGAQGDRGEARRAGLTRVLALDYGSARCGCAISDPTGTLATPLAGGRGAGHADEGMDRNRSAGRRAGGRARSWSACPISLSGEEGPQAARGARLRGAAGRARGRSGRDLRRALHDQAGPTHAGPLLRGLARGRAPAAELSTRRGLVRRAASALGSPPPRWRCGWRCCWRCSSRSRATAASRVRVDDPQGGRRGGDRRHPRRPRRGRRTPRCSSCARRSAAIAET